MGKPDKLFSGLGRTRKPAPAQAGDSRLPRVSALVEQSDCAFFWATNEQGQFTTFCAPSLVSMGLKVDGALGQKLSAVFEDAQVSADVSQRSLALKMNSRAKISDHVVRMAQSVSEKDEIWLQISGRPLIENDVFKGYFGTGANVTRLVIEHQEKSTREKFDEQTGFYNPAYLAKRFDAVFTSMAYAERSCALMILDIDQFRSIHERHGSAIADGVLREFSDRLRNLVGQRGEIGRSADDQFRIILVDADDRGELADMAINLDRMLSQPYRINGRRVFVSLSIGVAIAPYDAAAATDLVDAANLALMVAKQNGGGSYCIYSPEISEQSARELKIHEEIEGALQRGEFSLSYAPLVDAQTNVLSALIAELQWDHPDIGRIPFDVFWPIIDSSEAAVFIGEWMLRQACSDAASWPETLRLAIHLPQGLLKDHSFRTILLDAARANNVSSARIEIEIGEQALASDLGASAKLLDDIKAIGARSAILDFGGGNSSIAMLADLKVDRVDLFPGLVKNWAADPARAKAIFLALVGLAKTFGVTTSAREVDALDVLDGLVGCGIDLAAGPVFSERLGQDDIVALSGEIFRKYRPKGPPRQRAERIAMLRKIGLIHEDHYYDVLIRNLSTTGAKVTGIAGVSVGTEVVLDLGGGQLAVAKVVNSDENSQGLKFEVPLVSDGHGGLMTRHRISPYALAEAGLPVGVLGSELDALKTMQDGRRKPPSFVQLQL